MNGNHFIELASDTLGLMQTQMALGSLDAQNLTAASDVEAVLCSFMGLDFRHARVLLLPSP